MREIKVCKNTKKLFKSAMDNIFFLDEDPCSPICNFTDINNYHCSLFDEPTPKFERCKTCKEIITSTIVEDEEDEVNS